MSAEEIFVVEGKPDLRGVLWRVRPAGPPPKRAPAPIRLEYYDGSVNPTIFREADIGMLENIR